MNRDEADVRARAWADDWNSHDLERILAHYAPDAEVHSPVAARVLPGHAGPVVGQAALRRYWGTGLPLAPELRFAVQRVLLTVGGFTVLYENERKQLVAETMLFDDEGRVRMAIASYA